MKRVFLAMLVPLIVASCDGMGGGSPVEHGISGLSMPAATSLGSLVRVERKADGSIQVPDPNSPAQTNMSPTADEYLYVLYFEGKDKIEFRGKPSNDGVEAVRLVDSTQTPYHPSHFGIWTDQGAIVDKDIMYNGEMTARDGKFVFAGTMELGTPRLALVYRVPRDAKSLSLWDGDRRLTKD